MTKSRAILAAFATGTFVLGACSADTTDFKAAAEKYITGKEVLGEGSEATCDKPENTDTGTTFDCTATDAEGGEHTYTAHIDSKTQVSVSEVTGEVAVEETDTTDTTDSTDETDEVTAES